MPFQPIAGKYSPHMDVSMHPVTGVVSITVAFHINRGANCRLYELPPPYTGQPTLKRDWIQGQNNVLGPFGHGASLALPTGALLIAVPAGIDSAENVTPTIMIEPNFGPPFPLGGLGAKGETGAQGPAGPAGTADPALVAEVAELRRIVDHFEYMIALQQQKIDTQAQSIAAIETMLGNLEVGGGGDYPADDRELIRRLRDFLLPLLGP